MWCLAERLFIKSETKVGDVDNIDQGKNSLFVNKYTQETNRFRFIFKLNTAKQSNFYSNVENITHRKTVN
jgi:hypothetical protein